MAYCDIVILQEAKGFVLARICVSINCPVWPVQVILLQEPHHLPPALAVISSPKLSHPVSSLVMVLGSHNDHTLLLTTLPSKSVQAPSRMSVWCASYPGDHQRACCDQTTRGKGDHCTPVGLGVRGSQAYLWPPPQSQHTPAPPQWSGAWSWRSAPCCRPFQLP